MPNHNFKGKPGFIHLFFMGAVIVLFMVFMTLTSEAMDQKILRKEMELLLKLDYATEAYYLLLREGEMTAEEGLSYGNLAIDELCRDKESNPSIIIEKTGNNICITAWFNGDNKGEYQIEHKERFHDG